MRGRLTRAQKLRVAMFAQHNMDDLVPEQTAVEHVRKLVPNEPEAKVRGRVARMGLGAEKMETKARDLSGGEKARLLLGLATFDRPHLLILDEPTNHLDMDSREALVLALNDYSGAVILISHDRHLVEASAERLWLVHDGTVGPYDGDLNDYRRLVLRGPGSPNSKVKAAEKPKTKPAKITSKPSNLGSEGRKRVKQLESIMAKAEAAIQTLNNRLAEASKSNQPGKIRELATKKAEFERRLVEVEEEWLALSAELEA